MIKLYSYPEMFGLPDNNPYGLKVDTFLRLAKIDYSIEHIVDTKDAPRGQLPYIIDAGEIISDSNQIISHLSKKYKLSIDYQLIEAQRILQFLITRTLDSHLYWVMSYSRWQDERFWPLFKAELLKQGPQITEKLLESAREYNSNRYYYQGISRYDAPEVYQSGIDDLAILDRILGDKDFIFGGDIHSIDACCYGFLANIYYFDINTPLKNYIDAETSLGPYTNRIRKLLEY
ncbi:hypothetical protein BN59_00778 [Legionella massiliensis]|uniref:GST N-terminal domain-containing protein n=1 Tax=Legionella massiliensis TaxID=1034943 RepID=A0A078KXR0_9GAMM|nr:glutathione S-transferase family protein [Legionella massiliensis]CDZ76508.1 hypothetical protein BN59_00778 [Legionella massiliensis]CEE12246.1 hypothetical protein BN1094_00778 [Legionella massiliensis]